MSFLSGLFVNEYMAYASAYALAFSNSKKEKIDDHTGEMDGDGLVSYPKDEGK